MRAINAWVEAHFVKKRKFRDVRKVVAPLVLGPGLSSAAQRRWPRLMSTLIENSDTRLKNG